MASTPFKVVSWSPNDVITDEKLGNMVFNDDWLKDNRMAGKYKGNSVSIDTGIKLLVGIATIGSSKSANASKAVDFENHFTEGCKPNVTTGIISSTQRQIFVTVDGPGNKAQPTRDGMQIHVHVESSNKKKKKITDMFYVHWQAVGY
jgi:hypothetical protein